MPHAVVDDLDPPRSRRPETHRDPGRARVDRIFDQFLQRAGGAFDHLAGGDTIDQMLGESPY
jgi:hypothetical protein